MDRLKDKVAFVAGASAGIGRATARRFAAEGATVIFGARRRELLETLEDEIRDAGGRGEAVTLDIGDLDAYVAALEKTAEKHGKLDVFVHNAMYASVEKLTETSMKNWEGNYHFNVTACFVANTTAIRLMKPRGTGSIINISSIAGERAVRGYGAYGSSKAAMIQMSRSFAVENADAGIRVNVVAPGMIFTDSLDQAFKRDPDHFAQVQSRIPMGRFGTPEELAASVLFFASDDAAYVTGQLLLVDGGKYAELIV